MTTDKKQLTKSTATQTTNKHFFAIELANSLTCRKCVVSCQLSVVSCPRARGVATLPAVMVFGIMALVVAISVTTLSFTELFISQGSGQSSRAHFYAESGARDALIKIARDKNYVYETGEGYEIEFSPNGCALLNDCAKVLVTGSDTSKVVTSKGIMKSSTRTLQVVVALDSNGAITDTLWSEVTN